VSAREDLQRFDETGRPTLIAWFDDFEGPNNYAFLSNFYVGSPLYIHVLDDEFMTGEHAFAAMKTVRPGDYQRIRNAEDPHAAKYHGRTCELRPDWEQVKYDAMLTVIRSKFTLERAEGQMLLATADALLVEGTHWADDVWGVALRRNGLSPATPGRNWLGTMLMARRAELKAEAYFGHYHLTGEFNGLFVTKGK